MDKQRGNLDDVMPPESAGTRVSLWAFGEVLFWIVIGLLWLAFEGGIVGLLITGAVAIVVAVAWRDIARRAKNPIQQPHRGHE